MVIVIVVIAIIIIIIIISNSNDSSNVIREYRPYLSRVCGGVSHKVLSLEGHLHAALLMWTKMNLRNLTNTIKTSTALEHVARM
jgi:hypothetical protein